MSNRINYFAYGSNMNFEHMRRLCGRNFSVLGWATLPGYEFGPDLRGYVNIRPKMGAKVVGVLYNLTKEALDALDDFEGYPQVFRRPEVEVTTWENQKVKAFVYVETPEQFGGDHIKLDYYKRFMAGALENNLPQDWVDYLKSFEKIVEGQ